MKKLLIGLLTFSGISSFAGEFPIINPYQEASDSIASKTVRDHVVFALNYDYPFSLNFNGSRPYDPMKSYSACTPTADYVIESESLKNLEEPYINEQGVVINKIYDVDFKVYNEKDSDTYNGIDERGPYRYRGVTMTMSADEKYIYRNSQSCETFEAHIDSEARYEFVAARSEELHEHYSKMWFRNLF